MGVIIWSVLFCVFGFLVNLLFKWNKNRGKYDPFPFKIYNPAKPLETDKATRKKVLKNGFQIEQVPENLDAIIIGSGMGALTCATLMSRCGKKVLVLEQHDRLGGCTHTYKHKGFEFDIGIHYIGNAEEGSLNKILVDSLTEGQLLWQPLDPNFDTVVIDEKDEKMSYYKYWDGIEKSKQELIKLFPKEKGAVDQYFKLLKLCKRSGLLFTVAKILPKSVVRILIALKLDKLFFKEFELVTNISLKEALDKLTDNQELKTVLSYSFGDYGTVPSRSSFFMHGMLMNHILKTGGFYPRGGASEIAYQVIPGIIKGGGAVMSRAKVEQILFENGKAIGVEVLKTSSNQMYTIKAPTIISDAGIYNTYHKMVPKSIIQKHDNVENILKWIKPGIACMQVMVGLNGTRKELELDSKNYWIYSSKEEVEIEMEKYLSLSMEEAANSPIPLLFASFPSAKDSTWEERYPGKSTCVIVTFSNLNWFKEWENDKVKKRGNIYSGLKDAFGQQAWKQTLKVVPHLHDKVETIDCGTPLSHQHYLNSMHGEIYGIDHRKERFELEQVMELRADTNIPGLYLTGQDVFTAGFIGSAFGGVLAASAVLDRYLIIDLINLVKKTRKGLKKSIKKTN